MLVWIKYLDRVIRGEATQPSALSSGNIDQPVGGMTVIGAVLGALYGLCMGCYAIFQHGSAPVLQVIATMLKVPLLFLLTLGVTYPSLYVFNALVGSRLSALAVLRLLVISLSVMLTVLASLGPIVAFFAASTTSYPFMLLLNVVIFSVSGFLGLRYLLITLQRLTAVQAAQMAPTPPIPPMPQATPTSYPLPVQPIGALEPFVGAQAIAKNVRAVFAVWMVVFALVGSQMAWVLRPFLGHPNTPFTWLRGREANFFEAVFHALHALFS